LSSSVHGTKCLGSEIVSNLHIFKQASLAISHQCLSSSLLSYMNYLKPGVNCNTEQRPSRERVQQEDLDLLRRSFVDDQTITPMKSSKRKAN